METPIKKKTEKISALQVLKLVIEVQLSPKIIKKYNKIIKFVKKM